MKHLRLFVPMMVLTSALTFGSATLGSAAMAASAHNLQTGAHTANANDSAEDASAKQERQEQQAAAHAIWNAAR